MINSDARQDASTVLAYRSAVSDRHARREAAATRLADDVPQPVLTLFTIACLVAFTGVMVAMALW